MGLEKGAAEARCLVVVDVQEFGDECVHACADLVEEAARGGVERVVEIEDPDVDPAPIR